MAFADKQLSFVVTPAPLLTSYSTTFPATETPISQSGKWLNGLLNGLDWNNVHTTPNKAYGGAFVGGSSFYNDPIACLNPAVFTIAANQFARATVHKTAGYAPGATSHEIELLLRFSISAHVARGYEVLWTHDGFIYVVRWNGAIQDYTDVGAAGVLGTNVASAFPSNDGRVLEARIVGNFIKVYIDGVQIPLMRNNGGGGTGYDNSNLNGLDITNIAGGGAVWANGTPGVGFFPRSPAVLASYGWKTFEAGTAGVPAWAAAITQDLVWTPFANGATQHINDNVPVPSPQAQSATGTGTGGPSTMLTAWAGGAIDPVRKVYYIIAAGGHADYAGNEGYALDLTKDSPGWKRITENTPLVYANDIMDPIQVNAGGNAVWTKDGYPRAMHSTFCTYAEDRVWYVYQNSVTSGGGGGNHGQLAFNTQHPQLLNAIASGVPLTRDGTFRPWEYYGDLNLPDGGGQSSFGVSSYDSLRRRVYGFGGKQASANFPIVWWVSTNPATIGQKAIALQNSGGGIIDSHAAVYCADMDIHVIFGRAGGVASFAVYNPTANTEVLKAATGTALPIADYMGMIYLPGSHQLVMWHQLTPQTLYKVSIPMTGPAYNPAGNFVVAPVTTAGVTIPAVVDGNGNVDHAKVPGTKFALVPDMGDGRSYIVQVAAIAGPTYAIRLPAGGL